MPTGILSEQYLIVGIDRLLSSPLASLGSCRDIVWCLCRIFNGAIIFGFDVTFEQTASIHG